jgi:hypothetical protein
MQRPRIPFKVCESLHRQLNSYALAASAAGVGMLALAHPASAKIVYTPAHHVIGENESYNLAIKHQTDFVLYNLKCTNAGTGCTSSNWARLSVRAVPGNGWLGARWASALKRGARISKGKTFNTFWGYMVLKDFCAWCGTSTFTRGPWDNVIDRYLGLKFSITPAKVGAFHYGWARLNVRVAKEGFTIRAVLTGYAYETIPNKPIIAGKTHGPDVITVEPATLGHLARGASAIPSWREKD